MAQPSAEHATVLSHSQLFHGLPPEALADLVRAGTVSRHAAGETVLAENSGTPGLSTVLSGSVQIARSGKRPITRLGRGNFFGEISLFGLVMGATASVTTPDGCEIHTIKLDALRAWFKAHPGVELVFLRHLATELCRRLYSTTAKLE
jgi:CRP-like cAMP-binding protein